MDTKNIDTSSTLDPKRELEPIRIQAKNDVKQIAGGWKVIGLARAPAMFIPRPQWEGITGPTGRKLTVCCPWWGRRILFFQWLISHEALYVNFKKLLS